jgi:hypothetical protein
MNATLGEAEACSVGVAPAGCPAACFIGGSSDRQAILAMSQPVFSSFKIPKILQDFSSH